MSVYENKVITFRYAGGSDPGKIRLVFITGETTDRLTGFCFDRQSFRQFAISKITELCIESNAEVVPIATLPQLVDLQDLVDQYEDSSHLVYVNDDWMVAVEDKRKEPTILTLQYHADNCSTHIQMTDGQPTRIQSYRDGKLISDGNRDIGTCFNALHRLLNFWK